MASASAGSFDTLVGVADQGWWDDDHNGWGWGGWIIMWIGMLLFWAVLVAFVVWAIRAWSGQRPGTGEGPPRQSALDIARERYARGEINDEEFERIRRGLSRD